MASKIPIPSFMIWLPESLLILTPQHLADLVLWKYNPCFLEKLTYLKSSKLFNFSSVYWRLVLHFLHVLWIVIWSTFCCSELQNQWHKLEWGKRWKNHVPSYYNYNKMKQLTGVFLSLHLLQSWDHFLQYKVLQGKIQVVLWRKCFVYSLRIQRLSFFVRCNTMVVNQK